MAGRAAKTITKRSATPGGAAKATLLVSRKAISGAKKQPERRGNRQKGFILPLAAGCAQLASIILPPSNTIRPATIVVLTRPVSFRPCQGELCDLLKPSFAL